VRIAVEQEPAVAAGPDDALAGTELLLVPTGLMDPFGHVSGVLVPRA
jgi:hypothetical protein